MSGDAYLCLAINKDEPNPPGRRKGQHGLKEPGGATKNELAIAGASLYPSLMNAWERDTIFSSTEIHFLLFQVLCAQHQHQHHTRTSRVEFSLETRIFPG